VTTIRETPLQNRLMDVELRDHRLVAAAAEVHIVAHLTTPSPTAELRGRLTGPHCAYASTIEIAYPLRPQPTTNASEPIARVIVPEASFWEPQTPFLYNGSVELWDDHVCRERIAVRHGFRSLTLGPTGLKVNGRPLTLTGRRLDACTAAEATALRRAGVNLLATTVTPGCQSLWDQGDRLGFFLLGRVNDASDELLRKFASHPCRLGWLATTDAEAKRLRPLGGFVGFEQSQADAALDSTEAFDFLVDRDGVIRTTAPASITLGAFA
jgi:hypothetical protein